MSQAPASSAFDISLTRENDYLRRVRVSAPSGEVSAARRREIQRLRRSKRVGGFRKGKAPPHMIERLYGREIRDASVEDVVRRGYRETLRLHELRTVDAPVVSEVEFDADGGLSFRLDIEVYPDLDLQRTGGFRVKRPQVEVVERDVDEAIEAIRARTAALIDEDRPPREGDLVSVTIWRGEEEGGEEGGRDEPDTFDFEIGSGDAMPDVEAAILTLAPGEEGSFIVTFPDDGPASLAGTSQAMRIRLERVCSRELPAADDDLARGVSSAESLGELRTLVENGIRRDKEQAARQQVVDELVDAVVEANPFEPPPTLVSQYIDGLLRTFLGDDAVSLTEDDRERYRSEFASMAEREIKHQLVVGWIIEREGLEASREELDREVEALAAARDIAPVRMRRQLAREKRLDQLRRAIAVGKAHRLLMERSGIS